jgi:autotransporter-associated beta strand protein
MHCTTNLFAVLSGACAMRKLINNWDNLCQRLGFVRKNVKKRIPNVLHKRICRVEPLETRTLLSFAKLEWHGYDDSNNQIHDIVWSTAPAKTNWVNGFGQPAAFNDGDEVTFDISTLDILNVKISGNVKPSKITFAVSGYNISTYTSPLTDSISANDTTLTIQVNQQTIISDVIATISAPIVNPVNGGVTKLLVDASGGINQTSGNYYPTGTLILKGNNKYGATTAPGNEDNTVIKGYSVPKQGGELTYTGGVLVAGSPNALPNDNGVFRPIRVEPAATLAVETDGLTGSAADEWTNDAIPTLFAGNNPNFQQSPSTGLRSNFGIWADKGTSFEYSNTIPGQELSTNYNQNFVKLGIGTLMVSGWNRYPGTTNVNKGTLISKTLDSLPRYGIPGEVLVRNTTDPVNLPNAGYGNFYGKEAGVSYDGTQDPHSTLVVPAKVAPNGSGWSTTDIQSLLYSGAWGEGYHAKFDSNTNFGVDVPRDGEFSMASSQRFRLGYESSDPNVSHTDVGFVKLGYGTLDFGSQSEPSFDGPATIYEGTLQAALAKTTFPTTCSVFINNYATWDLNEGPNSNTRNSIRELHGEPRATITDNSLGSDFTTEAFLQAGLHLGGTAAPDSASADFPLECVSDDFVD